MARRVSRRLVAIAVPLAALLAPAPAAAQGHEVEARLGPAGIAFLSDNLVRHLPTRLEPPPMTFTLYSCSGDDATATQQNTVVDLEIHEASLTQPGGTGLRLTLGFSADVSGEVRFRKPFFCLGDMTCRDSLSLRGARAVVDLGAASGPSGGVELTVTRIDLQVPPDGVDIALADCAVEELANWVIGALQGFVLSKLQSTIEDLALRELAPLLERIIGEVGDLEVGFGPWEFHAALARLELASGVRIGAELDIRATRPPPSCMIDPGEPRTRAGAAPDLLSGVPSHLGLALNLGLLDGILYHVWSAGVTCTPATYDVGFVGEYLTDFPAGTRFALELQLSAPPRIETSSPAVLTLVVPGVEATLHATPPGGATLTARAVAEVRADAHVRIDQVDSALALWMDPPRVTRIELEDGLGLEARGFDREQIRQLLTESYLPRVFEDLVAGRFRIPLAFGASGYHGILRETRVTDSHLALRADLFRAPDDDRNPPDTSIVSAPAHRVGPAEAVVTFTGVDAEVPSELLRYRVWVNGIDIGLVGRPAFELGRKGVTATYEVAVSAVDLAGNEDPSPATATVSVDGVRPTLEVLETPDGLSGTGLSIRIRADDDVTPSGELVARVELFATDAGDELVAANSYPRGATDLALPDLAGGQYRAVVYVADEAGNEAVKSVIFSVPGGGGCAATGGGAGAASLLLAVFALLALRVRRAPRAPAAAAVAAAIALAGCDAIDAEPAPPGDEAARELPACASDLARSMWDAMVPVIDRGTIPVELAAATATSVESRILVRGSEIFPRMGELIASAEQEVSLLFYVWHPGSEPTQILLGALKELELRRWERGATAPIKVRLVVDTSRIGAFAPPTEELMPAIMAEIEAFELDRRYVDIEIAAAERSLLDQFGTLHVKTVVVDRRAGVITGANPETHHNAAGAWHDSGAVVYGNVAAAMHADFEYTWRRSLRWLCPSHLDDPEICTGEPGQLAPLAPIAPPAAAAYDAEPACVILALSRQPAPFANNSIDNPKVQGFLAAFAGARRVIKIETPNINDDAFKAAIVDAALRGVEVRLVVGKGFNELEQAPIGGPNGENVAELYRELVLRGAADPCDRLKVRWYSHDGIEPIVGNGAFAAHTKYTSIDDQIAIVGSTNMDTASWNFSQELNVAIDSASLTAAFDARLFDADWARAIPVEECRSP